MSQRVVLFVLLGSFVTCFVGTCAVGTLTAINGVVSEVSLDRPSRVDEPPPFEEPPPSEPSPTPDPLTAEPADEPPVADENAAPQEDEAFAPPLVGFGSYAVYHQGSPSLDPFVALKRAAKGSRAKVFDGEAPPETEPPFIELQRYDTEEFGLITGLALDSGHGLSAQAKAALPNAKQVSVLVVTTPVGTASAPEIAQLVAAFAQLTGGVLWDEQTQEYFSLPAWRTRRVTTFERGVPQASMHVTVFADPEGGAMRLETAGLQHFGLPELRLSGVPSELEDEGVALLQAVSQVALEQHDPIVPGLYRVSLSQLRNAAERKRLVGLAQRGAEQATDVMLIQAAGSQLPMLGVALPGSGAPGERLEAALTELFGTTVLPGPK